MNRRGYTDWPLVVIIAIVCGGVVLTVAYAIVQDKQQKKLACAHAMQVAHSSQDSIAVILRCEVPTEPQVIPIYIPSGR